MDESDQHEMMPIHEKIWPDEDKDRLTHRFRKWLDTFDTMFDETTKPENLETHIDLYTLFSEFIALKNEIKLESRQMKAALERYNSVVEVLQSGYETIQKEQSIRRKDVNELKQITLRMIITEILDIRDRLEEGLRMLKGRKLSWLRRLFRIRDSVAESMMEGQEMILGRLDRFLLSHGITPIDTRQKKIDPHLMKVVEIDTFSEIEDGMVIEEIRKGFMMNDELIRVAEVKVNRVQ